jgi:hypothetical protein
MPARFQKTLQPMAEWLNLTPEHGWITANKAIARVVALEAARLLISDGIVPLPA